MWLPNQSDTNTDSAQTVSAAETRRPVLSQAEIDRFKSMLYTGVVEFSYYKTLKDSKNKPVKDENGNAVFDIEHPRPARGTMQPTRLPLPKNLQDDDPNKLIPGFERAERKISRKYTRSEDSIVYYDLDANGFRMLKRDGLIEFKQANA